MFFLYNDDSLMAELLSGKYTGVPDSHSIFLKFPLNYLLTFLYTLCRSIPWYAILLFLCIALPFLFLILTEKDRTRKILFSVIAPLIILPSLIQLTFTTTAAVLVAVSFAFFRRDRTKDTIVAAILFSLSYCVRNEIFLVSLPFYLVLILWKLPSSKKKYSALFVSMTAVLSVVFFIGNFLQYNTADWKTYRQINDKRVTLYDYTWYIPYENAPDLYAAHNISYEDYLLIDNYALTFEHKDWETILNDAATITTEYYPPYSLPGQLYRAVRSYLKVIFAEYLLLSLFLILLYAALFWFECKGKHYYQALITFCLLGGRNLIWIYLVWKGRLPERIILSLCITEMMLLLILLSEQTAFRFKNKLVLAIACLYGVTCIFQISNAYTTYRQHCEKQQDFSVLQDYMKLHPETTFLLDVRSVNDFNEPIADFTSDAHNYFQVGGWFSASPIINQRIQSFDQSNSSADACTILKNNPSVVFVLEEARNNGWLETYMQSRYEGTELYVSAILNSNQKTFYIYNCR